MNKGLMKFLGYTFGAIFLVLVLTHYTGFGSVIKSLGGGYTSVVGAFITPTKA